MAFDNNLLFSNNGTLTATGNSSIVDVGKWPADGAWVELVVTGAVSGTTPTLDAQIRYSDASDFSSGVENGPTWPQVTATGFTRALLCQSKRRYARITYTVGGTTPSFGGVTAGIVSGPQNTDVSG